MDQTPVSDLGFLFEERPHRRKMTHEYYADIHFEEALHVNMSLKGQCITLQTICHGHQLS